MIEDKNNRDGIDLSGVLRDSGTGVKFEDSDWRAVRYNREPQYPKIIQWVIRYSGGIVRDEKQARYVLLGFVAAAIIVSFVLLFGIFSGTPKPTRYREDIPPEVRRTISPEVWKTLPSKFK